MKKRILPILTILVLLVTGCGAAPSAVSPASQVNSQDTVSNQSGQEAVSSKNDNQAAQTVQLQGWWGTVTKVSDGDTLEVDSKKVRLIGVNTPETVKPGEPVFPYGKEASEFTKKALTGKKVFVEVDVQPTDKFGRTLGYVYLQEPKTEADIENYMFNAILLREGYAQLMTIPPNVKYQDLFVHLQKESREGNKGLWALGIYADEAKSSSNVFLDGKSPFEKGESEEEASSSVSKTTTDQKAACPNPTIKGNINSKGKKLYHVKGVSPYYEKTKAEMMFCTEEEAEAAGFVKAGS